MVAAVLDMVIFDSLRILLSFSIGNVDTICNFPLFPPENSGILARTGYSAGWRALGVSNLEKLFNDDLFMSNNGAFLLRNED